MENNKRNSSIELLRIIGMFIICCWHCTRVFHIEDFQGASYLLKYIPWGNIGNLIFIVISNYFLSNSKEFKLSKIKTIIIDQFAISMIVTFITIFIFKKQMDFKTLIKQIFIFLYGGNWFITCWIFYYMIHPLLNIITDKLTKKEYTQFVIALIIIYGFLRFPRFAIPCDNLIEFIVLHFIVLHFIVSYCKKYYDCFLEKKIGNVMFLSASIVVLFISVQCITLFADFSGHKVWDAGNYRTFPPMVIMVLSLIYNFKQKSFYSPFINGLGNLCLLHYMMHENYLFQVYGGDLFADKFNNISFIERWGYLLIFAFCYYIITFVFAFLYKNIKLFILKNIKKH